jgi:hypothetical protein
VTRALTSSVLAMLLGASSAAAHHSIAGIYDSSKRLTIEGTVTAFHFVNPHPFVELDVTDRNGRTERWRLEMDNRRELAAIGMTADTIKPGDRVSVVGSAARNQEPSLYVRTLERRADGFLYEQIGSVPRVRMPR